MKVLGSIIFIIGIISALVSSAPSVPLWGYFSVSVTLAALGAIAVRLSGKKYFQKHDSSTYIPDETGSFSYELLKDIHNRIYSLVKDVNITKSDLKRTKQDIESIKETMNNFIEIREYLIKKYGIGKASALLTSFASGERNLSRAWSALVDDYPEEMIASLLEAEIWFSGSIGIYRQLLNIKSTS